MASKEEDYKRMWSEEEDRIKHLSEEARRQVESVRARLIGGLERIDLSNRAMIEASQSLQVLLPWIYPRNFACSHRIAFISRFLDTYIIHFQTSRHIIHC